jgi:hypothetical protein
MGTEEEEKGKEGEEERDEKEGHKNYFSTSPHTSRFPAVYINTLGPLQ